MMKRNLLKELGLNKKKRGLGLMLAGLAAFNVGFTGQVNSIETSKVAEVDILPTPAASVADFSSMNDLKIEISEIPEIVNQVENVDFEENVVETSYADDGDYVAVMSMEATAYLPSDGDGYGITATGIPAT